MTRNETPMLVLCRKADGTVVWDIRPVAWVPSHATATIGRLSTKKEAG